MLGYVLSAGEYDADRRFHCIDVSFNTMEDALIAQAALATRSFIQDVSHTCADCQVRIDSCMSRCDDCIEKRSIEYAQKRFENRCQEYTQLCHQQSAAMLREDWTEYNRLTVLIRAF